MTFGPNSISPVNYTYEDSNEDGFDDLVSHYLQKETGITCEDRGAIITGQLTDGGTIIGFDSVNPIPCL